MKLLIFQFRMMMSFIGGVLVQTLTSWWVEKIKLFCQIMMSHILILDLGIIMEEITAVIKVGERVTPLSQELKM